MSYDHLSIEERIQKAAEYSLLLTEDQRPPEEITAELQQMFGLDKEQAVQAISRMRREYSSDPDEPSKKGGWTMALLAISIIAVLVNSYSFYTQPNYSNVSGVARMNNLVIDRPITKTIEKRRDYFTFRFKGYLQNFRFYSDYYKYADGAITPEQYPPGFVLGIEVSPEDSARMENRLGKVVEILNLIVNGRRLYDYGYRNRVEKKKTETVLALSIVGLALSVVLRILFGPKKKAKAI